MAFAPIATFCRSGLAIGICSLPTPFFGDCQHLPETPLSLCQRLSALAWPPSPLCQPNHSPLQPLTICERYLMVYCIISFVVSIKDGISSVLLRNIYQKNIWGKISLKYVPRTDLSVAVFWWSIFHKGSIKY